MKKEKETHEKVFALVTYIIRYIETCSTILLHPKRTFANYNSIALTKPGPFLIINILLSYSIGKIIGIYTIPEFPFEIHFLQNSFGGYAFITTRFILGFILFLLLLKCFIKYKKIDSFISVVFPIFCYGSVVYLPIILVKQIYYYSISRDIFNLLSGAFSNIPLSLNLGSYIKLIIYLTIPVVLLVWWLWLIYTGLRLSKIKSPRNLKKAILFSYITFSVIQTSLLFLLFVHEHGPLLRDMKTIITEDIDKELSKEPPNYFKASILARRIANNEKMPAYFRYAAKLREITYTIATPIFKGDEKIVSQVLNSIKEYNYIYLQKILDEYLKSLLHNEQDSKRLLYLALIKELEEAERIRNSENFIDLNGKNLMFMLPIPTNVITLFP